MFSREYWKIFKNIFFTEQLRTTASLIWKQCLETYSKSNQTSKMELFAKTVIAQKLLTIFAKTTILDVWLVSEYILGACHTKKSFESSSY